MEDSAKIWARSELNRAVQEGVLIRPSTCTRCGVRGTIQGHHPDYSRPLDVIWLCTKCHGDEDSGRPIEYTDIRVTALRSLWSKNGVKGTVDFELFSQTVVQNCSVCGCKPPSVLTYRRKGEVYHLHWNHIQRDLHGVLQPVCPTCRFLLTKHDLPAILKTCARIMARKMHGKVDRWLLSEHRKAH